MHAATSDGKNNRWETLSPSLTRAQELFQERQSGRDFICQWVISRAMKERDADIAAAIQGKDCLVQKFRNSSVMLEAAHYRPKVSFMLMPCQFSAETSD